MNMDQNEQEAENSRPYLFKKRALTASQYKPLEKLIRQLIEENDAIILAEKDMLTKFLAKGEMFISRLEKSLEEFKSTNAETVILTDVMVNPEAVRDVDKPGVPEDQDTLETFTKWYHVLEDYVISQREKVKALSDELYNEHPSKIADETDLDQLKNQQKSKAVQPYRKVYEMLFWAMIIMLCAVNVFFFYEPNEIEKCTGEPMACVLKNVEEFFTTLKEGYMALHNITNEDLKTK